MPNSKHAWMAELVDALDSKSNSRKGVSVRFRLEADLWTLVELFYGKDSIRNIFWYISFAIGSAKHGT